MYNGPLMPDNYYKRRPNPKEYIMFSNLGPEHFGRLIVIFSKEEVQYGIFMGKKEDMLLVRDVLTVRVGVTFLSTPEQYIGLHKGGTEQEIVDLYIPSLETLNILAEYINAEGIIMYEGVPRVLKQYYNTFD